MEKLKIQKKKSRNGAGEWSSSFCVEQKMNAEVRKLTSSAGWVAASRKMATSTKSPASSRASTPSNASSSSRISKREKKRKKKDGIPKQKKFKMVLEKDEEFEVDYVSPEEEENTEDSDTESKPMSEESETNYSIGDEEDEDDMSLIDEEEGSVHLDDDYSDIEDDEDVPPLELPDSSRDLLVPNHLVLPALGVYEVLRHFRSLLRLSPMLFEDFCAALVDDDTNILLTECFISVLKSILREEDTASTQFGPPDQKDSKDAALSFLDYMTWPEIARAYLESTGEHQECLKIVRDTKFPRVAIEGKIEVLKTLTDIYLSSNKIRDKLMTDGVIHYDDNCRVCHKLGDLLCCETCPAVYHLACCDPPLSEVPDDEWQCVICRIHKLKGVHNCEPQQGFKGQYLRHETIGMDRHGNKYWFLVRRLFVEGADEVRYYSTQEQFEALRSIMDPDRYEIILCEALKDVAEEFPKYSSTTLELTYEALPDNVSTMYLTALQARVKREQEQKRERQREEMRKKREEEEKKRKEEEAIKKQEEERRKLEEEQRKKQELEELKSQEAEKKEESIDKPMETKVELNPDQKSELNCEEPVQTSSVTSNSHPEPVQAGNNHPESVNTIETKPLVPVMNDQSPALAGSGPVSTGSQPLTSVAAPPANGQVSASSGLPSIVSQSLISVPPVSMTPLPSVSSAAAKIVAPSIVTTPKIVVPGQGRNIQVIKLGQNLPVKSKQPGSQPTQLKTLFVLNKDGTRTPITLGPAGKLLTPGNTQSPANRQILVLNSAKVALPKVNRELKKLQFTGAGPKTLNMLGDQPGLHQFRQRISGIKAENEPAKEVLVPPVVTKKVLTHEEEAELYFRLGEDKGYRLYQNHYTDNTLALNKIQHKEERDRERYLSYKFSLSGEGEFKWMGETLGSESTMLGTLRSSLLHLEHQIPLCFMHTKWDRYRNAWGKMVMTCNTPQGFAAALGILEMATRVVVKRSVWRNSHGLPRLKRVTVAEKEEWDKKRKHRTRAEEEESNRNAIWCKYPFPIKCTLVWKVRGEEYRMTGYGGWRWVSTTRLSKLRPVRPKPYTLAHEEGGKDTPANEVKTEFIEPDKKDPVIRDPDTDSENSASTTSTTTTVSADLTEDRGVFEALVQEATNQPKPTIVKSPKNSTLSSSIAMETDSPSAVTSQACVKPGCDATVAACDVINVSENLLKRTPLYNKKWAASRLDILLGWRMFQKGKDGPTESVTKSTVITAPVATTTTKPVVAETKSVTVTTDVNKPGDVTMAISVAETKTTRESDVASKPVTAVTETSALSANQADVSVLLPAETKPAVVGVGVAMATTPIKSETIIVENANGGMVDGVASDSCVTATDTAVKLPDSASERSVVKPCKDGDRDFPDVDKVKREEMEVDEGIPSSTKDLFAPRDNTVLDPTLHLPTVSDIGNESKIDTNLHAVTKLDVTTTNGSVTTSTVSPEPFIENTSGGMVDGVAATDTVVKLADSASERSVVKPCKDGDRDFPDVDKIKEEMEVDEAIPSSTKDLFTSHDNTILDPTLHLPTVSDISNESKIDTNLHAVTKLDATTTAGSVTTSTVSPEPCITANTDTHAVCDPTIDASTKPGATTTIGSLTTPAVSPDTGSPAVNDPITNDLTEPGATTTTGSSTTSSVLPDTGVSAVNDPATNGSTKPGAITTTGSSTTSAVLPDTGAPAVNDSATNASTKPGAPVTTGSLTTSTVSSEPCVTANPGTQAVNDPTTNVSIKPGAITTSAVSPDTGTPAVNDPTRNSATKPGTTIKLEPDVLVTDEPATQPVTMAASDFVLQQGDVPQLDATTQPNASNDTVTTQDRMEVVETTKTTISDGNQVVTVVETQTSTVTKTTSVTRTVTSTVAPRRDILVPQPSDTVDVTTNTPPQLGDTTSTSLQVKTMGDATTSVTPLQRDSGVGLLQSSTEHTGHGTVTTNASVTTSGTKPVPQPVREYSPDTSRRELVAQLPRIEFKQGKATVVTTQQRIKITRMSRARRVFRNQSARPLAATQGIWKLERYRKTSATLKKEKAMKLPLPWKFCSGKHNKKKSIFRLPAPVLRKIAISGGQKAYRAGFTFGAKWFSGLEQYWLYPCPRPTFSLTWRYKIQNATSFASVAHLLRVFWHAIKWDKMTMRPQTDDVVHTMTSEEEIITTELLKRKDDLSTGLHSDYFIRRITVPILDPEEEVLRAIKPAEGYTPSRKGLRSRRSLMLRDRPRKDPEPRVQEIWVPEEQVELWQIRQFDMLLKQQTQAQRTTTPQSSASTLLQSGPNTFVSTSSGAILPTMQKKPEEATTPRFNIVRLPLHQNAHILQKSLSSSQTPLNTRTMIGKSSIQKIIVQAPGQQFSPYKLGDKQQAIIRSSPAGTQYIVQGGKIMKPIIFTTPLQQKQAARPADQAFKFQQQPQIIPSLKRTPVIAPRTPAASTPQQQQTQIKLSMAQLSSLLKAGSASPIKVPVSLGNGKSGYGQIQLITPGSQVTPTPGQQLMQTRVRGEIRKFLFTLISESAPVPSTPANEVSLQTASLSQRLQQIQRQQLLGRNRNTDMKKLMTDKDPLWGSRPQVPERSSITTTPDFDRPKKKPYSRLQREEGQRQTVVAQVMKSILDRIEKREEIEMKKRKREEAAMRREQNEQMKVHNRQTQFLHKHRDHLKQEILKRRAIVEKYLTHAVKNELHEDQRKQRRIGSAAASKRPKKAQVNATVTSTVLKESNAKRQSGKQTRKRRASSPPPPDSKKQKMINTGEEKKEQLYCICLTPYDPSRFYIGCDLCLNWFHGSCVGIPESRAKSMSEWICVDCQKAKEEPAQELYCLCRTPYDDSKFYIGCDICQDWYHGDCVGMTEEEAEHVEFYTCPRCKIRKKGASARLEENLLTKLDRTELTKVIRSLRAHKMAWPFLQPVSKVEVPSYHKVIKKPMDLLTVMNKLPSYTMLSELMGDVSLIFDNCRMFNGADSALAKCAEIVESVFVGKMREYRTRRKSTG